MFISSQPFNNPHPLYLSMSLLVTGCCGFIGFHLSLRLLKLGYSVVGIDSVNDYYSTSLKLDRLNILLDVSRNLQIAFF